MVFIGQKGDSLSDVPQQHPAIDKTYLVRAGKFRRYHGEGWRQVFDLETQGKNLRDAVNVLIGIWQSYWIMRRLRPNIILTKGGFVSVPVALGGALNGIPYITHDSDSTPSLASRIIARWAKLHAVALPKEDYPYPQDKTLTVGVPVSGDYVPVDTKLQQHYRSELGLEHFDKVLFVTGGGNGADYLNRLVADNTPALLERSPNLAIVHIAGRALEAQLNEMYDQLLSGPARKRVLVKGFVTDMYRYSGAADLVIARAGATALAELAVQGKACIIIPAKQLIWQSRHAKALAHHHAIIDLPESEANEPGKFADVVADLLQHRDKRTELAHNLAKLSQPDTAKRLAMVLLDQSAAA